MTLEATAAIVALVGLWLLVLGPAYQAIVEVTAQRRELGSVLDAVALVRVRPVERWWWLLPPIAVLLWWSRLRSHLRTIEDRLPEVSGRRWTHYLDSAVGWGIVATGALVVATGQTSGNVGTASLKVVPALTPGTAARPGTTQQLSGTGFGRSEQVTLTIASVPDGSGRVLGHATTGADGALQASYTVPAATAPGPAPAACAPRRSCPAPDPAPSGCWSSPWPGRTSTPRCCSPWTRHYRATSGHW